MPPDDPPLERATPTEQASAHYLDAVERLERVIDVQIEILEGIDEKAEHVTRLVGLLLGIVLSVLSLATELETVSVPMTTPITALAFGLGVVGLLASMVGAILTYLGSRMRIGLSDNVGLLLSTEEYQIRVRGVQQAVVGHVRPQRQGERTSPGYQHEAVQADPRPPARRGRVPLSVCSPLHRNDGFEGGDDHLGD